MAEKAGFQGNFIFDQTGKAIDTVYQMKGRKLGQGTYGSVSAGVHIDTGVTRAIKTISKKNVSNKSRLQKEIDIMKLMDHPNIIRLFETFEDHQYIYLVMELCTGGELFDRIIAAGSFSEADAATLLKQMFSALYYCHSQSVVHRDLKPENFLMATGAKDAPLKLIDFGLAAIFKPGDKFKTKAGTPYYVAPQVLSGEYDEKCDVWSLGVMTYIFFCGYPPFYGDTDNEILSKVRTGHFDFPPEEWSKVNPQVKKLISAMLEMNPANRPSIEQVVNDQWVQSSGPKSSVVIENPKGFKASLKRFHNSSKFRKAALHVVAQNISAKKIQKLTDIFHSMDADRNGTLTTQEITQGLQQLVGSGDVEEWSKIIAGIDTDGSGIIEYTEFLAAALDQQQALTQELCWTSFRRFDLDNDGKISKQELHQVMGDASMAEIGQMIKEHDIDGDGEISFDEFMSMIKGAPELVGSK